MASWRQAPIFWLLAAILCIGTDLSNALADPIGTVTKVVNEAQVGTKTAGPRTPIYMDDRLRTGSNARLQVTFRDSSVLTLGEKANVIVDRYVFDPEKSKGQVVLKSTQGAFRFAGGQIKQMSDRQITVNTPAAALAVRGTEFWGAQSTANTGCFC